MDEDKGFADGKISFHSEAGQADGGRDSILDRKSKVLEMNSTAGNKNLARNRDPSPPARFASSLSHNSCSVYKIKT